VTDSAVVQSAPVPAFNMLPQDRGQRQKWLALVPAALSLALMAAIFMQVRRLDGAFLWSYVPTDLRFWAVFPIFYMVGPIADWVIFRKLWAIPISGIAPLLRKYVYNELILGYLGEAYFYGWARARTGMTATPFGVVKDVAILSAIAGNLVTIILLGLVWPFVNITAMGIDSRLLVASLVVVLSISLGAALLRNRVLTLGRAELTYIMTIHLTRIGVSLGLTALLWHICLPHVALTQWLLLATLRMLVSRLPFVPNKELVFAGIALMALGHQTDISTTLSLIAGLILAVHVAIGTGFALFDLARLQSRRALGG